LKQLNPETGKPVGRTYVWQGITDRMSGRTIGTPDYFRDEKYFLTFLKKIFRNILHDDPDIGKKNILSRMKI
jgi:hypothetical protein